MIRRDVLFSLLFLLITFFVTLQLTSSAGVPADPKLAGNLTVFSSLAGPAPFQRLISIVLGTLLPVSVASHAFVIALALTTLFLSMARFVNAPVDGPESLLLYFLVIFNPLLVSLTIFSLVTTVAIILVVTSLYGLIRNDNASDGCRWSGALSAGALLGTIPFFFPLVLIPLIVGVRRSPRPAITISGFVAGIALWMLPVLFVDGIAGVELVAGDLGQRLAALLPALDTSENLFELRRIRFLESLIWGSIGGSPEANRVVSGGPVLIWTVLVGSVILVARGIWWMFFRDTDGLMVTIASLLLFATVSILQRGGQNGAIGLAPFFPLLLILAWRGGIQFLWGGWYKRIAALCLLAAYAALFILTAATRL